MYTIEMKDEQVDAIVKDVLKKDYRGLCKDIDAILSKEDSEGLSRIDKEDLQFNIRIRNAMKIVFEYYFSESEQKEVVGA